MSINKLKKKLRKKPKKKEPPVPDKDLLSTGSTLLNLACSGRVRGGFAKGRYHFLVGDSASGKTWLSMTCLAEASMNEEFDDYRFIYDNGEDGALMDMERFFGTKMADRIEPPRGTTAEPEYSETIEEFYYNADDAIKDGRPFIYILDSMDSLSSDAEEEKFEDTKKKARKGTATTGSFGDGKAKKNSANLRRLRSKLKKNGSILIIINQTRDNLGFGFETKSRSGGHALRFYAHLEAWSSIKKRLTRVVKKVKREIGILAQVQVKKNRFTGRLTTITVPLYHSHGIDDVGSCIDYLIEEGHWSEGSSIKVAEWGVSYSKEKLIAYIEEEGLEDDLRDIVAETWKEIEEACRVKRKNRYV